MLICNYVYEHVEDGTTHTVRYTNVFPTERLFNWVHVGHFRPDQHLLMHSVILPHRGAAPLRHGAAQAHLLCG